MKKLVLLSLSIIFLISIASFSSVLGTQYMINEGESIIYNGKTITLAGVSSSSSVVVEVDGIAKAINQGESKTFGGIEVKVVSIYYYPKENEISSALLEISESTTPINKTCSDSDGGKNYYTKGSVAICTFTETVGGCGGTVDRCEGNVLIENYCEGNDGKSLKYTCPYGCADGACVKVNCKDYDNSPNYINNPPSNINPTNYPDLYTKSYGTGIYAGSSPDNHKIYGQEPDPSIAKPTINDYSTYYDYCANSKQLNEAFCMSDGRLGAFGLQCPNGCKDGACIKEQPYLTIGLGGATCTVPTCSVMKAYNQVSIDGKIYTIEGGTFDYVNTTVGKHTFRALDTIVNDTGGKFYFVRWTHIVRQGVTEYCYTNPCVIDITETSIHVTPSYAPSNIPTCTDSDGGLNYYEIGSVKYSGNPGQPEGVTAVNTEYCLDEIILVEHYCENGLFKSIEYKCPNGCYNGACIRETITTTIPGRCWTHAQCSQSCDYMGTDKWQYSRRWTGTCPENVYGCMTGDCCLGQCLSRTTGECFCLHTNKVDIYGDVCPVGTTCGSDCYCHPITDGTKTQIKVTSPKDGQIVSGKVTIVAEASGTNRLGDMFLNIQRERENIAKVITFTVCGEGAACPTDGGDCVYTKSCNYDWDTTGYDGGVLLTATVTDSNNNKVTDTVKVDVVNYRSCDEQCRLKGYRYGSCNTNCDAREINIGIDRCTQDVACASCPAGQVCPACPTSTCCCASKKTCPYECCVNDPDYLDKSCPAVECPVCITGEECPPCIQPKCMNHRCSWYSQQEFVIKFKEGWNMFSFPVDIRAYLAATSQPVQQVTVKEAITGREVEILPTKEVEVPPERQCESPNHVWHYTDGKYIDILNSPYGIVNGWGYWVKMSSDCIVRLTGNKITIEDFSELEAGWNQIGAPSEAVNFFHVIGNCNLLSGPWWFNSASKKYEKAQVLKLGEGYFVKVNDKCRLGSDIPPLPPEELGIGKAFRIG